MNAHLYFVNLSSNSSYHQWRQLPRDWAIDSEKENEGTKIMARDLVSLNLYYIGKYQADKEVSQPLYSKVETTCNRALTWTDGPHSPLSDLTLSLHSAKSPVSSRLTFKVQ
nr:hypothetical protein Itr_chr11CG14590 [Ipomoea trifida]